VIIPDRGLVIAQCLWIRGIIHDDIIWSKYLEKAGGSGEFLLLGIDRSHWRVLILKTLIIILGGRIGKKG